MQRRTQSSAHPAFTSRASGRKQTGSPYPATHAIAPAVSSSTLVSSSSTRRSSSAASSSRQPSPARASNPPQDDRGDHFHETLMPLGELPDRRTLPYGYAWQKPKRLRPSNMLDDGSNRVFIRVGLPGALRFSKNQAMAISRVIWPRQSLAEDGHPVMHDRFVEDRVPRKHLRRMEVGYDPEDRTWRYKAQPRESRVSRLAALFRMKD